MNPFIPLGVILAGFPFFSGGGSTKAWVKKTLTNVDGAVFLLKFFIFSIAAVFFAISVFGLIFLCRRRKQQKMITNIIALLQRLRTDISLLHNEVNITPLLQQELEKSRKQALDSLRSHIMHKKLLKKRLNSYRCEHFAKTLTIIAENRVNRQNQILLIDQWVKNLQN